MKFFILLFFFLSAWCYETLIAQSIFTGPINDVYGEWNVLNYYMDYRYTEVWKLFCENQKFFQQNKIHRSYFFQIKYTNQLLEFFPQNIVSFKNEKHNYSTKRQPISVEMNGFMADLKCFMRKQQLQFKKELYYTKFITLPPHSTIRITFDFWKYQLIIKRIDQWGADDSLIIYIDGNLILNKELDNSSGIDQCGGIDYEQIISIDKTTLHNFNSALIVILVQSQSNNVYWGIQNIKLYINECPIGCQICDINDSKPEQCQAWSLAYQSLTETSEPGFEISDWIVTNARQRSSTCLNIPLLCKQGGLLNYCHTNTKVTLTKTIPYHTKMRLHFRFFKFDIVACVD